MNHKDDYQRLLDEMLAGVDTEDAGACRRAYDRVLEIADEQFSDDLNINEFIAMAAQRLGRARVHYPIMQRLIDLSEDAKLYLSYVDGAGPELVGNEGGLRYLSDLAAALAECEFDGEHVHLYAGEPPMVGWTYPLTIYRESEDWFTDRIQDDEERSEHEGEHANAPSIRERDIDPAAVAAFCVVASMGLPPGVPLAGGKIYRVIGCSRYDPASGRVWSKNIRNDGETKRMYVFDVIDDDGKPFNQAFDLDDPEVVFFTSRDLDQVARGSA